MLLTLARHLFGALAAWVASWALSKGVALDPAALTGIMIAVYALVEKILKPAASSAGEIQPGGVSAATTEREKMLAGQG